MSRKPKLIHLTHHTCLAMGLEVDSVVGRLYEPQQEYRRSRYDQAYGDHARDPALFGHLHCHHGSRTSLLTTDLDAVTCQRCLEGVANDSRERLFEKASSREIFDHDRRYYEKRAEAWCDDNELKMRAWLSCCRHVGAPCPRSKREAIRRLRAARADYVLASVKLATFTFLEPRHVERLTKAIEKMEPADRKLMRGAMERAKEADALIAKATRITDSIEQLAKQAAKRVKSHAVVELPAGAA